MPKIGRGRGRGFLGRGGMEGYVPRGTIIKIVFLRPFKLWDSVRIHIIVKVAENA